MLFSSFEFIIIFLPLALAGFFVMSKFSHTKLAIGFLVLASLVFYGWWKVEYLGLLVFSLLFNFGISRWMARGVKSKLILWFGIAVNLALIGYFKYTNFALDIAGDVLGVEYSHLALVLPLGISFFTFQQVAFLVDSYRGITKEARFLHYCLFVTFFPQLIAGPIVHHSHVMGQFEKAETFKFQLKNFNVGLFVFTLGLIKKTLLADNVAAFATPVFIAADAGLEVSTLEAWGAALAYTMQLYFDFSGYSDMAIGLGLMFGIRLPINFYSPYKAANISEFWRYWHMTLSQFLRDYVYIPLGGNRCGEVRRYGNLMATMLLGGLWHGAGWTFIIWGGLHGLYLAVNHGWQRIMKPYGKVTSNGFYRIAAIALTFILVVIGWVLFRATTLDGALETLSAMFLIDGISLPADVASAMSSIGIQTSLETVASHIALREWIYSGVPILALVTILAFFTPNVLQILQKNRFIQGDEWQIDVAALNTAAATRWAIFAGAGFLFALSAILTEKPSEFLYFNF